MKNRIRILVADDHPVFVEGLIAVLCKSPSVRVIGSVGNGRQALEAARRERPDVLLLDVEMPELSGVELAGQLLRQGWKSPIVLLTMHKDERLFNEAMDLGIKGYVLKESAAADILQAITMVAAGQYYVSPALTAYLVHRSDRARALTRDKPGLESLTVAERRILKFIASDLTTKEIAEKLDLSPRTIETHRAKISRKLGLQGSHSLLKFAFEHRSAL